MASLGVYADKLREVVLQIKRPGNEPLTAAVGNALAEEMLRNSFNNIDLIAPVPIHWSRRITRGFSCPELLAESLAARLAKPAKMKLLACRRKSQKQGLLLPTERRRNVHGAYRVSRGYVIQKANVLVVDDVMTTGATANELSRVLLSAGAAQVSLAVVARGIGFDA